MSSVMKVVVLVVVLGCRDARHEAAAKLQRPLRAALGLVDAGSANSESSTDASAFIVSSTDGSAFVIGTGSDRPVWVGSADIDFDAADLARWRSIYGSDFGSEAVAVRVFKHAPPGPRPVFEYCGKEHCVSHPVFMISGTLPYVITIYDPSQMGAIVVDGVSHDVRELRRTR